MSIDNQNLVDYVEERKYNSQLLLSTIKDITLLVLKRHFPQCLSDDEMLSVGISKAVILLKSPHINTNQSLTNLLYTGIRNEVGNLLKKEARIRNMSEDCRTAIIANCIPVSVSPDEFIMHESVRTIVDDMVDRIEMLGFHINDSIEEFFNDPTKKELSGYADFIIRAAVIRTLI